jgi:hypothetical protein
MSVACRERFVATVAAMMVCVPAATVASRQDVDPEHSTITVRVFKAGLFRAFGDNHEIAAPIKAGSVEKGRRPRCKHECSDPTCSM